MSVYFKVPPINWQAPIVEPGTGRAAPQFIRWWQLSFQNADTTQGALTTKADKSIRINAGTGLEGGGTLAQDVTLALADTAVVAGSYTNTNLTVDAQGRITAAANGSAAAGDVVGPATANDNAIARYDGTTGKLIQNSDVTIADNGLVTIAVNAAAGYDASVASSAGSTQAGLNRFFRFRGTQAARTTVLLDDIIGRLTFVPFVNVAGNPTSITTARIEAAAAENGNASSNAGGTDLRFQTTALGTVAAANRLIITAAGHTTPGVDNTSDLGLSTRRWRNVFLSSGSVINWNNGNATITHSSGLLTSNVDIVVPNEAYSPAWDGSFEVPTKNAVYDKIESLAPGGSPAELLVSEVVTTGSQASVTFSSIAAIYRDLKIVVRGRGTNASNDEAITLQFNGDTGANYDYNQFFAFSGATSSVSATAQASMRTIQIPAATAAANYSGSAEIVVADYRGTVFFKSVYANGADYETQIRSMISSGAWKSTAAITSVVVALTGGAFVDGSVVSLYGRL